MQSQDLPSVLGELFKIFESLIELHRTLLDCVRFEKASIVSADLNAIIKTIQTKKSLIELIQVQESQRIQLTQKIARHYYCDLNISFKKLLQKIQNDEQALADQMRSSSQVLLLLIERIRDQNLKNESLLNRSLEHIKRMQKNLKEKDPLSQSIYDAQGVRRSPSIRAQTLLGEA